jgi:hypothetical protein
MPSRTFGAPLGLVPPGTPTVSVTSVGHPGAIVGRSSDRGARTGEPPTAPQSWVCRWTCPGRIGSSGWVRSSAWIWVISSTHSRPGVRSQGPQRRRAVPRSARRRGRELEGLGPVGLQGLQGAPLGIAHDQRWSRRVCHASDRTEHHVYPLVSRFISRSRLANGLGEGLVGGLDPVRSRMRRTAKVSLHRHRGDPPRLCSKNASMRCSYSPGWNSNPCVCPAPGTIQSWTLTPSAIAAS